jgi:hypothetical protein
VCVRVLCARVSCVCGDRSTSGAVYRGCNCPTLSCQRYQRRSGSGCSSTLSRCHLSNLCACACACAVVLCARPVSVCVCVCVCHVAVERRGLGERTGDQSPEGCLERPYAVAVAHELGLLEDCVGVRRGAWNQRLAIVPHDSCADPTSACETPA